MQDTLRQLRLTQIAPDPDQPRKTFDQVKLQELADSIQESGLVQPVVVRPIGGTKYQLIAGERRYRAAQIVGLKTIPAVVRDTDGDQVRVQQIIENAQRDALPPLEEARAFQSMLDDGWTAEALAKKIGRSEASVRDTVSLLKVPQFFADQVARGVVSASAAVLVARVPDERLRERIARCIVDKYFPLNSADLYHDDWESEGPGLDPTPLTYDEIKEFVMAATWQPLHNAPFPKEDADLPGGPCKDCPKRSGNLKKTRAELRFVYNELCSDLPCWQAKEVFHRQRQWKETENRIKVITERQATPEVRGNGKGPEVKSANRWRAEAETSRRVALAAGEAFAENPTVDRWRKLLLLLLADFDKRPQDVLPDPTKDPAPAPPEQYSKHDCLRVLVQLAVGSTAIWVEDERFELLQALGVDGGAIAAEVEKEFSGAAKSAAK